MNVITNAPIIEESSSLNGKKARKSTGKLGANLKTGYGKLVDAGAFPVIGNLLGLNPTPVTPIDTTEVTPIDTTPPPMSTTKKVVIGVVVVGVIVGIIYLVKKSGKISTKK
jgi:hypothetical protein